MKDKTNISLRHNEYYNTQQIYDELYAKSLNKGIHKNLMHIILSDENIKLAYRNIKANTGSKTSGVDNKTIEDIGKMDENDMILMVRNLMKKYKPFPVKRIEIPKSNGKTRPLGIPTIKDRMVQQCILQVLEPICEAHFYNQSFGFRPGRSAENAIANAYKRIQLQKLYYVVNVDIESFFDNINHDKLIRQLWTLGIQDRQLICIIKAMLKAKIQLPNGELLTPKCGTPQGGILSPLLANVVLNELDWWVVSNWQNVKTRREYTKIVRANGETTEHHKYEHLKKTTNLKEMWITRYADDFKIFCRTKEDADKTLYAVQDWLEHRLKLKVSPEKTYVTDLTKESMEFLGFEISAKLSHNTYVVESHVSKKSIQKIYRNLKELIVKMQRPTKSSDIIFLINKYNAAVIGIQNYYCIATHVSKDFSWLANQVLMVMHNRLGKKISKNGVIKNKYLRDRYAESEQIRFFEGALIAPIGYVQHKHPMAKNFKSNFYTEEGRSLIHKELCMNKESLKWLLEHPVQNRTTEYNDNRISKYVAQNGKCYITGEILDIKKMHLHHIKPLKNGGTDAYNNLVLIDEKWHRLIHATEAETIQNLLSLIVTKEQLDKINKLRLKAENAEINKEFVSQ